MAHTEKGKISWSFQRPQLLLKRDSQGTNLRAIETRSAGFEALPSGHKPETGGTGANGALTLSKPGEACVPGLRYSVMCDSDAWFSPTGCVSFPFYRRGGTPGGERGPWAGGKLLSWSSQEAGAREN